MKKFNEIGDPNDAKMPLSAKNYVLLLVGAAVILLGMILMSGGGSDSSSTTPCFRGGASRWRRFWSSAVSHSKFTPSSNAGRRWIR